MTHRSRLSGFIIDCQVDDLGAAADFWAQALGCSIADRDAGDGTSEYQMLGDTPGDLHIEVQKVVHASRVHLDIESDDVDAEASRLEALDLFAPGLLILSRLTAGRVWRRRKLVAA